MLKCSRDRCVWAPQSLSAGTLTGPRLSCSTRVAVMADPFVRAGPNTDAIDLFSGVFFWHGEPERGPERERRGKLRCWARCKSYAIERTGEIAHTLCTDDQF